jgi:DNA excision repair protein ERCC-2
MNIRIDEKTIYLSVRDLIRFTPHSHRILSSFPLPQRGMLGRKAQTKLQQSKQESYGLFHKEITVSHVFKRKQYQITLQGRIDGIYELSKHIEVEEIKTVLFPNKDFKQLDIKDFPQYTEQVLIYCYLLFKQKKYNDIRPIVTLINLTNDKTRSFKLHFDSHSVLKLINHRFEQIIKSIESNVRRNDRLQKQLTKVSFNLPEKRPVQEKIMTRVAETLGNRSHHMISAPTGTGKTAAVLFPAIKYAILHQKRIMYVTSKNTQQAIIRDTLKPITEDGLDLSVCFLRASKEMCANDVLFCHEDYCPYVKNYQEDTVKNKVTANILKDHIIMPDEIFTKAKEAMICPAEIMFDLAATSDILIGDYNYIFDPRTQIKRLFLRDDLSDWILIIDEAHNLYQRTIDTLSPELSRKSLIHLKKALLNDKLKIFRHLKQSLSDIDTCFQSLQQEGESQYASQQYFTFNFDRTSWLNVFRKYEAAFIKYLIFKIQKNMLILDDPFEDFYYKLRGLVQIAVMENDAFIPFFNATQKGQIKIQCCDPAWHIQEVTQKFHSVIAMSATLDPLVYYQEVLGFPPESTIRTEVSSPFSTKNRQIIIMPNISTYYRDRYKLYERYAEIIREVISVQKGNYIVFCPSFEFLQNLYLHLGNVNSELFVQRREMSAGDRGFILSQLKDSNKPVLLLAVMGGILSEGVDFKGKMCIGVILFSPALPKITFERELIREYYDQQKGDGFYYAYLYPGINKVVQSVGRLVRSQEDRGIIVLVGERFAEDEVNRLFPDHWFEKEGDVVITDKLRETIERFWQRFD